MALIWNSCPINCQRSLPWAFHIYAVTYPQELDTQTAQLQARRVAYASEVFIIVKQKLLRFSPGS
jgi:hypothetical protein